MARYALVQSGTIINWIEWDGQTRYEPPDGIQVMTATKAKGLPELDRSAFADDNPLEKRIAALEQIVKK